MPIPSTTVSNTITSGQLTTIVNGVQGAAVTLPIPASGKFYMTSYILGIQPSNMINRFYLNPATIVPSATFFLPPNPLDAHRIVFYFGGTITANNTVVTSLSILPTSGQQILQTSTPLTAKSGDCIIYVYNSSNITWYRENL